MYLVQLNCEHQSTFNNRTCNAYPVSINEQVAPLHRNGLKSNPVDCAKRCQWREWSILRWDNNSSLCRRL